MNSLWSINLDTLQLFYEMIEDIEKNLGKILSAQEREIVFLELMKSKEIKPIGNTELNKKELIKEYISHGKKILNIDSEEFKIIKPKEQNET